MTTHTCYELILLYDTGGAIDKAAGRALACSLHAHAHTHTCSESERRRDGHAPPPAAPRRRRASFYYGGTCGIFGRARSHSTLVDRLLVDGPGQKSPTVTTNHE